MRGLTRQPIVRDALLALLVLGLTFLNFGHTNQAFAAGGRIVATTSAFCGNPFVPADGDHAPCHACRIGIPVDLPPPPVLVEPVAFIVAPVVYPPAPWHSFRDAQAPPPLPRGPPLTA